MAVLVGVGAATAVGGALLGTLIPQAQASMEALDFRTAASGTGAILKLFQGIVMLGGTVLTLAYFHFSAGRAADGSVKRNAILELLAWGGRIFIAITLGALFAGVYMAALTAMIERLSSLINFAKGLLGL
jgi:heme/copper-type cytochrome/quinol oxidase subunit 2